MVHAEDTPYTHTIFISRAAFKGKIRQIKKGLSAKPSFHSNSTTNSNFSNINTSHIETMFFLSTKIMHTIFNGNDTILEKQKR